MTEQVTDLRQKRKSRCTVNRLKKSEKFHGLVLDDTSVFKSAAQLGLAVLSFDVILPEPDYQTFERRLSQEYHKSQFWYGFPDGNGECNCTTWLERIGLPLLTGRMNEFVAVRGVAAGISRRFGDCV